MTLAARLALIPTFLLPLFVGCSGDATSFAVSVSPTPASVLDPKAPDEKDAPAGPGKAKATAVKDSPKADAKAKAAPPAASPAPEVKLQRLNWDALQKRIAANPHKARYTLVDVWATDCAPCKENFPHLVEMHRKLAPKGLDVLSVSLDDPSEARVVKSAEEFLKQQGASFTNVLLDEEGQAGFEKFDINAIPAVFVYGPDGKLIKRFTLDDPDHQFTYEDVEKYVTGLIEGKKDAK